MSSYVLQPQTSDNRSLPAKFTRQTVTTTLGFRLDVINPSTWRNSRWSRTTSIKYIRRSKRLRTQRTFGLRSRLWAPCRGQHVDLTRAPFRGVLKTHPNHGCLSTSTSSLTLLTMGTMQIGDYMAWISVEGHGTALHGIERSKNGASCWVASEVGKKFSVNWYNTTRQIPLQAVVLIDGTVCDNHIMLDAERYPDKPNGVGVSYTRTSDYTRRDFVFSSIQVSDDDAYLNTIDASLDIGTIQLQLWRFQVQNVVTRPLEHSYGGPVLEEQVVHERSKKAGAHHVKFGEEYPSPAPTVDIVNGFMMDTTPFITFTFKYRPLAILMANDIVPRPEVLTDDDPRTHSEIRRLEERLKALRSSQDAEANRSRQSTSGPSGVHRSPTRARRRIKQEPYSREVIDLT